MRRTASSSVGLIATIILLATACGTPTGTAGSDTDISAYQSLRTAYAARDADAAAEAYAADGKLSLENQVPPLLAQGHREIVSAFQGVFQSLPVGHPVDLNYRFETRSHRGGRVVETGAYRLRLRGAGDGFGRFRVERDAQTGLFLLNRSLPGDRDVFERMTGPLLFDADLEDLDPEFYGRLTGRYRMSDGCELVVTHSAVRVLVRNTCDQTWRGLERRSGVLYGVGRAVLPRDLNGAIEFDLPEIGPARRMILSVEGNSTRAERNDPYLREDVTFRSADGTALSGTLWLPKQQARAATVLVHGSGPQDRNGYASILAVLADLLAGEGHIVLAYDKRGSGQSGGDGDRAGFDVLGRDAESAREFVRALPQATELPAGFAGSSQAGWVVADAIQAGADPAHVILLGAAGAALTVPEQTLYNTEVLMTCAGFKAVDIDLALRQQAAFFELLAGRSNREALRQLTSDGLGRPGLADWLFPVRIPTTSACDSGITSAGVRACIRMMGF